MAHRNDDRDRSWRHVLAVLHARGFLIILPTCPECQGHGFTTLTVSRSFDPPHRGLGSGGQSSTSCVACRGRGTLSLPEALDGLPALEDALKGDNGDADELVRAVAGVLFAPASTPAEAVPASANSGAWRPGP